MVAVTRSVCDNRYPGTREGFILVVDVTPTQTRTGNGDRRRTPGLRREEVAQLAGVGTTWYTWLEQGRDVRASLEVLEALSRALRLTPAERAHLILLGRGEQAPACKP